MWQPICTLFWPAMQARNAHLHYILASNAGTQRPFALYFGQQCRHATPICTLFWPAMQARNANCTLFWPAMQAHNAHLHSILASNAGTQRLALRKFKSFGVRTKQRKCQKNREKLKLWSAPFD